MMLRMNYKQKKMKIRIIKNKLIIKKKIYKKRAKILKKI